MTTNTQQEIRALTTEELDTVSGGASVIEANFTYGDLSVWILADGKGWTAKTSSGSYCQTSHGW